MLVAALVLLSVAVVVAGSYLAGNGLSGRVKRRCLVSCKDGQDFSGVLWSAGRGVLVLKQASIVGDSASASVDGEVVIFRADVAFVQFP